MSSSALLKCLTLFICVGKLLCECYQVEVSNGEVVGVTDYVEGSKVEVKCNEGFEPKGDMECRYDEDSDDLEWFGDVNCEMATCKKFTIEHGKANWEVAYPVGSELEIECEEGYSAPKKNPVCTIGKILGMPYFKGETKCKKMTCEKVKIAHGKSKAVPNLFEDAELHITCKDGYKPPTKKPVCTYDAVKKIMVWKGTKKCIKKPKCKPIKIENGDIVGGNNSEGSTLNINCNSGYEKPKNPAVCVYNKKKRRALWVGDIQCVKKEGVMSRIGNYFSSKIGSLKNKTQDVLKKKFNYVKESIKNIDEKRNQEASEEDDGMDDE